MVVLGRFSQGQELYRCLTIKSEWTKEMFSLTLCGEIIFMSHYLFIYIITGFPYSIGDCIDILVSLIPN